MADRFYFYDPEDSRFHECNTADEARQEAEERLESYSEEALDGWSEMVDQVEWGRLVPISTCEQCDVVTAAEDPSIAEQGWDYQCSYRMTEPDDELSALRARVAELEAECDRARANYQFMVERAADEKLDGYRELGARAAAAENECDRLRARLATLEAPPVVPEGWTVQPVCGWWTYSAKGPASEHTFDKAHFPAVLRALAYAIETGKRPPHASDGEDGGE